MPGRRIRASPNAIPGSMLASRVGCETMQDRARRGGKGHFVGSDEIQGNGNRLLTGWKQISRYFGKDESTAKRWAASKGLPVHRVPGQKRAAVYAYSADLDLWLKGHRELGPEASATPSPVQAHGPAPRRGIRVGIAAGVGLLVLVGLAAVALRFSASMPILIPYQ